MNVLHNFSKEVIDTIKKLGIIVRDLDEHGNEINYYNLPQWFKDVNGHIFDCPFNELPLQAKSLSNVYDVSNGKTYSGKEVSVMLKNAYNAGINSTIDLKR